MDTTMYGVIFSIFEVQKPSLHATKVSSSKTTEHGIEQHIYEVEDCKSHSALCSRDSLCSSFF